MKQVSACYFNNQPMLDPSPERPEPAVVYANYLAFAGKLQAAKGDARVTLVKECFDEHIMKLFPFDTFYFNDCHADYYALLALHLKEDIIPDKIRDPIICTMLDLANYYKYIVYYCDITRSNFFEYMCLALETANELKYFMTSAQINQLIQNAVSLIEIIYQRYYCHGQLTLQIVDSISKIYGKIANGINPKYFQQQAFNAINKIPCWRDLSVLTQALGFTAIKFASASSIYFSADRSPVGAEIDLPRAFQLFAEIPAWADEYGEAQYLMSKLVCHHSNFTPADFSKESDSDRKARLTEMKPYLDRAVAAGCAEAIADKYYVDQQLIKLIYRHIDFRFFTPHNSLFKSKNIDLSLMDESGIPPAKRVKM